jgi:hypothetical protein
LASLVPGRLATLWSDAKFAGRLGIKLPCDWQIFGLLKSANARPGSETEDAVELSPVLSFALQSFLYLPDIVPLHDSGHSFADVRFRNERRRAWSRVPYRQQYEGNPSARGFAG